MKYLSQPVRSTTRRNLLQYTLTAAVALACGACAEMELGPEPDNSVHMIGDTSINQAVSPVAATTPATTPATTQASTEPATTQASTQTADSNNLDISVNDAILIALEHNSSLRIQRYNPLISRTGEQTAKAAFDPTLSTQITTGRTAGINGTVGSPTNPPSTTYGNAVNGTVGLSQYFPTGTTVGVTAESDYASSADYSDTSTRLGLTVNQALLQGAGLKVNLAALRQAEISTQISQYELRGVAESLIATVEETYWDYALAQRQIEIYQTSLDVALQQLYNTNEFIKQGTKAENERAAAEAEVALRREDLINAKATLETTRLTLLQLLNPGKSEFWKKQLTIKQQPFIPQGTLEDVAAHVSVALQLRPDLNQARLQIKKGDLDVVKTKNGLLPKLDLFVTMGKTGYSRALGGSITNLDGPYYDALIGLKMDYPIGNAAARAAYRSSVLTKEQSQESLENLTQLAQVDVRSAYIEVNRQREQIVATTATLAAQEATYRAEQGKYNVGKSTSLLVAQVQRDLVKAQINQAQAVTGFLKALIALYQSDGSLLERRGIHAPGFQPVTDTPLPGTTALSIEPRKQ